MAKNPRTLILMCIEPFEATINGNKHSFRFNNMYKIHIDKQSKKVYSGASSKSRYSISSGLIRELVDITDLLSTHFRYLKDFDKKNKVSAEQLLKEIADESKISTFISIPEKKKLQKSQLKEFYLNVIMEMAEEDMSNAEFGMKVRNFCDEVEEDVEQELAKIT